jgi:hypothetical protein
MVNLAVVALERRSVLPHDPVMRHDEHCGPSGLSSEDAAALVGTETLDAGDLALIDDMLARSPAERLDCLETTLRSLEALRAATGSPIPAE